ncbi:uncharacterized protein LOC123504138 isoform X1 [Portunus trituberculatus]|uniref:uncharacterized protein LOC123504138 isoform X1 n=1 Tax=Portunus trituberculatus TaxID=210409 RepID=UPI001E1CDA9E|nr:uncharacterized protein LOC123504138 isoform X1 [Portunus trituberculatus]XP_045110400.1 uncharacterized protein LOC123504138 isoform X1 [Portunus trituberculatus]
MSTKMSRGFPEAGDGRAGRIIYFLLASLLLLTGQLGLCLSAGEHGRRAVKSRGAKGSGSKYLTLEGVAVPVYKFRGEDAQLECRYERGTDPLYSVKWYKDDNEFYRYVFGRSKPKQTFMIPGVTVDVHRSNTRRVLLKSLTFNSTGVYKCEVSADSPHFHTYEKSGSMVVVELPQQGPVIQGMKSHYRVGDTARLNCTSAKSKPAAELAWYINEEKVYQNSTKAVSEMLVEYYPWVHSDGLESRRLGLSFTVDKSHFIMGNLVLKCKATVATVTREEDATISEGEQVILEQREKLVYVRSSASTALPVSLGLLLNLAAMAVVAGGRPVT